jgi:hypothetical protein
MEAKSKTKVIVPRTPQDEHSIAQQVMDVADDDLILSDFQGMPNEMLDKWVYEFKSQGKIVRGLSWVGTKEILIWLAGKQRKGIKRLVISEIPEKHELKEVTINGANYVDATVCFEDTITHRKMVSTVRQPYKGKRSDGSAYDIDVSFVPRIAESKAQRNAIQKLIPAQSLALFIGYAKEQGKTLSLTTPKNLVEVPELEMKKAAPYFSNIEKLKTVEEAREYYRVASKLSSKGFSAQMIMKLQEAINIKGTSLKRAAAKEAVGKMEGVS